MKLSMEWTNHLKDEKQKADLENAILNSTLALSRLYTLLSNFDRDLTTQEVSDDYSTPSWSHKQAHRNGQRSTLKRLLTLLSFTQGTKNG